MLLPKQAAAFWEGHKKSSALFQKICWEEPEKQKTRSCRAQELSRSSAQWRGRERRQFTKTDSPDDRGNRRPGTTKFQDCRFALAVLVGQVPAGPCRSRRTGHGQNQ